MDYNLYVNSQYRGYNEIRYLGNKIAEMNNDISYVKYKNSFNNWNKYQNYWQSSLFNWDEREANLYVI